MQKKKQIQINITFTKENKKLIKKCRVTAPTSSLRSRSPVSVMTRLGGK